MISAQAGKKAEVKSILFLTDFSGASESALPFAATIARRHGAVVHALHVLIPDAGLYTARSAAGMVKEAEEEQARAEMQRVESQLAGLQHEGMIEWGTEVWPRVEQAIRELDIDLIVLGTHGRTGAEKLLLGSAAEEIFRRSPVPVLTIGPGVRGGAHNGARFHRMVYATDFSAESLAAAPLAFSLAEESGARMLLLVVMRRPESMATGETRIFELSVAEAIHRLYEIVPKEANLEYPPEVAVEYGEPGERIVEVARERGADLIVLGVRHPAGRIGAATHLGGATAHKVVAHAGCPVLTVRG